MVEDSNDNSNDTLKEFLVESMDALDRLDQEFVALEKNPTDKKMLNSIFRTIHSVKGTSGFLNFNKLGSVAHVGENLLDSLRAGRVTLSQAITSTLLELVDAIRKILGNIEASGKEGDQDYTTLKETLARLNQPATAVATVGTPSFEQVVPEHVVPAVASHPVADSPEAELERMFEHAQKEYGEAAHVASPPSVVAVEPPAQASAPAAPPASAAEVMSTQSGLAETSLRVDVALLDQLMNLVGELVLARNQILQYTKTQTDSTFISTSQRLNLITSELQEGVMKTRMQPIVNVWNKFPRVVRDVARAVGKQVRIEMHGKETDLDKTIIEAIKDPLTHIVRNSVDHGIEMPAVRIANGKPAEGVLLLKAFHEGGNVIIEITDDGAGLNTERIKAKALERGIITPEKAGRMSEAEINKLIFLPGFSTVEKVTNISGRGVGMDVVRSNIEKIGGVADVISYPGKGSTIRIKIPLTLAIVPALVVTSGGERFAVPQVSLLELVRIEGAAIAKQVEEIHGTKFYRLRGDLLPLVYLNDQLKLDSSKSAIAAGKKGAEIQPVNIVVVKAEDRQFGLVVDAVHDTAEIVVKPLGRQLKDITVLAGATIMGDGHVALILDILGIAHRANVVAEIKTEARDHSTAEAGDKADKQSLLIVQAGEGFRAAVPLSLVNRLEVFPCASIERAAGRKVVQYRGGILPLVDLPEFLTGTPCRSEKEHQVVVYVENGKSVGFVVDKIIDIVQDSVVAQLERTRKGIKGSAVIQKQTTDLLDLHVILTESDPRFFDEEPAAAIAAGQECKQEIL